MKQLTGLTVIFVAAACAFGLVGALGETLAHVFAPSPGNPSLVWMPFTRVSYAISLLAAIQSVMSLTGLLYYLCRYDEDDDDDEGEEWKEPIPTPRVSNPSPVLSRN